jgi:hypothetical protein
MTLSSVEDSAAIARHLPGEPVVWTGRPDPMRVAFAASSILLFAVPWTAISLYLSGMMGWLSPIAWLFVIIGVGMCLTPLRKAWRARHTLFAITRSRLIVLRPKLGGGVQLESYSGADIRGIRLDWHPDGVGDLIAVVGWQLDSDGDRQEKKVEMRGVADVQGAHAALEALKGAG